jgi:hypothetical protein
MSGTPGLLIASLISGSIGLGVFLYGLRQRSPAPMLGGALIMVAGYFLESALLLWLVTLMLLAGTWWLARHEE